MTLNPSNGDRSHRSRSSRATASARPSSAAAVTPDSLPGRQGVLEIVETADRATSTSSSFPTSPPAACVERAIEEERRLPAVARRTSRSRPVAALAKRAEQHFGCPQDVEWAIDGRRSAAAAEPPGDRLVARGRDLPRAPRVPDGHRRHRGHPGQPPRCEEEHRWPRRRPDKRFISPYDDAGARGRRGLAGAVPVLPHVPRGPARDRGGRSSGSPTSRTGPHVFKPFDTIMVEFASRCLGQYNTRHYLVPPANGVDYRVHNGYCYMSPVAVPEEEIGARVPQFLERAGHYFANWPTLLENWHAKMHRRDRRARGDRLPAAARGRAASSGSPRAAAWTTASS